MTRLFFTLFVLLRAAALRSPGYSPYFSTLNSALQGNSTGEGCVVVDMDSLDHNIRQMCSVLAPGPIRLVTKSLNSLELLDYIMQNCPTNRLMTFSGNMLLDAYLKWGSKVDYLLGMSLQARGAQRVLKAIEAAQGPAALLGAVQSIQWLVDSEPLLKDYQDLQQALSLKVPLRINLEIDVNLHRGGIPSPAEAVNMLHLLNASQQRLQFSGFMGYDGHVPFAPAPALVNASLQSSVDAYSAFVLAGKEAFPSWFTNETCLNGAGSKTVPLYSKLAHPLNDFSAGSAFLMPGDFDFFSLSSLLPAEFVAAPVIKVVAGSPLPFVTDKEWAEILKLNPQWCQSVYAEGIGASVTALEPPSTLPDPFYSGIDGAVNLAPTQSLWHLNCTVQTVELGDYLFLRPKEADAVLTYSAITLIRGQAPRIVGQIPTFRGGI